MGDPWVGWDPRSRSTPGTRTACTGLQLGGVFLCAVRRGAELRRGGDQDTVAVRDLAAASASSSTIGTSSGSTADDWKCGWPCSWSRAGSQVASLRTECSKHTHTDTTHVHTVHNIMIRIIHTLGVCGTHTLVWVIIYCVWLSRYSFLYVYVYSYWVLPRYSI